MLKPYHLNLILGDFRCISKSNSSFVLCGFIVQFRYMISKSELPSQKPSSKERLRARLKTELGNDLDSRIHTIRVHTAGQGLDLESGFSSEKREAFLEFLIQSEIVKRRRNRLYGSLAKQGLAVAYSSLRPEDLIRLNRLSAIRVGKTETEYQEYHSAVYPWDRQEMQSEERDTAGTRNIWRKAAELGQEARLMANWYYSEDIATFDILTTLESGPFRRYLVRKFPSVQLRSLEAAVSLAESVKHIITAPKH